jgi:hypothetical protein
VTTAKPVSVRRRTEVFRNEQHADSAFVGIESEAMNQLTLDRNGFGTRNALSITVSPFVCFP